MFMLIWDTPFYLYDLRIIRYIDFGIAIVFVLAWLVALGVDVELMYGVDEWAESSDTLVINSVVTTILSYCLIEFLPTFMVNG